MGLIKILPDNVANKISAGEVVQRPASVVKELIENAIDAGANDISIVIKDAGKSLIQVIDNGSGMTEEDALQSFQRFATSKITTETDLENLSTLGFRGEALASISSVAQVELKTRQKTEKLGVGIKISGGQLESIEKIQSHPGTTLSVRNLFYNVPARRKFLKTNTTEFKHIFETIQAQVLLNTDIRWKLISNDDELYRVGSEDILERMDLFFGHQFSKGVFEVKEENEFMSIRGYLGKPAMMKRTKNPQFLFINNRITQNRTVSHAVMQAYGELLGEREFPFYLIYLDLDPKYIDVNVHPAKMEVKFEDERNIYNMIHTIVKRAVAEMDFSPKINIDERPHYLQQQETDRSFKSDFPGVQKRMVYNDRHSEVFERNSLYREFQEGLSKSDLNVPSREPNGDLSDIPYETQQNAPLSNEDTEQLEILIKSQSDQQERCQDEQAIWQLHNTYILTQIKSGLMIVDQHVAHERIVYERSMAVIEANIPNSQQLLFPHVVELKAWEEEILHEIKLELERLGFVLKFRPNQKVIVEAVPPEVKAGSEEKILHDLLEQFLDYQEHLNLDIRDNIAKSYACRSSIMAGQKLSKTEMISLIDQLFATKMPYVCPHGRPIIINLSINELHRMFGRT
jgi:DNA mismatch repair protein MutL